MKKFLLVVSIMLTSVLCIAKTSNATSTVTSSNIEMINDSTVLVRDVDRISISRRDSTKQTAIIDASINKPVVIKNGSFVENVSRGNYFIVSQGRISKTAYERVEE